MPLRRTILLILGIMACLFVEAQIISPQQDTTTLVKPVSSNYLTAVSSKADQLEQKLNQRSAKVLQRLQKQEEKIKRKLTKKDSHGMMYPMDMVVVIPRKPQS